MVGFWVAQHENDGGGCKTGNNNNLLQYLYIRVHSYF